MFSPQRFPFENFLFCEKIGGKQRNPKSFEENNKGWYSVT